ncbi:MAG TPA: MOP flippase family protein [Steroidobacteraceae bacterium]|nr:MOP flippase family protein [Steroidobacteraceae bacterium]
MTLGTKVIQGVSWSVLARLGSQLFQLAFSVVLARLLSPVEFGEMGMLIVFTGFAQALADCGLTSALIQRQEITEAHRSTTFWLQLIVGWLLAVAFFCGAPLIAAFYDLPELATLIRAVSCVFVIQAWAQTQYSLLLKELKFKQVAIATVGSTVAAGVLAVILALRGYGVWALVWQSVAGAAVTSILVKMQSSWRPRFVLDTAAIKDLGGYAAYLTAHSSLNYWLRNGDNLLIGKVLGAQQLGIYARAYTLMLLPINNVSAVLGQVMFPALSMLQSEPARFSRSYLAATRMIAFVSFPLMAGAAILAEPFINLLLGGKWAQVIPVFRVLSTVGLFQSIIFPVAWVFTALGKTRTQFILSCCYAIIFIIAIAIGSRFGIIGVAYAYAAWTLLAGWCNLHFAGRYMGIGSGRIIASVARIAWLTAIMGGVLLMFDRAVAAELADWARLALGILISACTFGSLCVALRDPTFLELKEIIARRPGARSSRGADNAAVDRRFATDRSDSTA